MATKVRYVTFTLLFCSHLDLLRRALDMINLKESGEGWGWGWGGDYPARRQDNSQQGRE